MEVRKPWIVALTGASGTCYGRRLLSALLEQIEDIQLEVVLSEAALRVMHEEENIRTAVGRLQLNELLDRPVTLGANQRVTIHSNRNIGATIASGSYQTAGMIIVPCSMKTLAATAHGLCENLIQRAADVTLKEKRTLIIVPRETPLSSIHLENMLKLSRMDVRVVPAMPGFYQRPASIAELVDDFVLRLADQMGIALTLGKRWEGAHPREGAVARA